MIQRFAVLPSEQVVNNHLSYLANNFILLPKQVRDLDALLMTHNHTEFCRDYINTRNLILSLSNAHAPYSVIVTNHSRANVGKELDFNDISTLGQLLAASATIYMVNKAMLDMLYVATKQFDGSPEIQQLVQSYKPEWLDETIGSTEFDKTFELLIETTSAAFTNGSLSDEDSEIPEGNLIFTESSQQDLPVITAIRADMGKLYPLVSTCLAKISITTLSRERHPQLLAVKQVVHDTFKTIQVFNLSPQPSFIGICLSVGLHYNAHIDCFEFDQSLDFDMHKEAMKNATAQNVNTYQLIDKTTMIPVAVFGLLASMVNYLYVIDTDKLYRNRHLDIVNHLEQTPPEMQSTLLASANRPS